MRWTSLVALLVLACKGDEETDTDAVGDTEADTDTDTDVDTDADTDADTDTEAETDTETDTDVPDTDTDVPDTDTGAARPDVDVVWDPTGVTVTVSGVTTSGFDFGIAETADMSGGWFGEDCYNGTAGYNICHVFTGTTGTLESIYDDVMAGTKDLNDVVSGRTTLFDEKFAPRLTYIVVVDSGECWAFGRNPSYYLASGPFSSCELLPP